jgi:pimeloyl-ACP methyl ester carboxylesterase
MKRLVFAGAGLVVLCAALGAAGYYLTHNVDWVRVYYKRFKAPNVYVFDEIAPHFKQTDPAKLIRIRSVKSAARIRRDLIDAIWGPAGLPIERRPLPYTGNAPDQLSNIPGVAAVKLLKVPVDLGYTAYFYVMEAAKPNGRLVVYQHGYAGTVEAMTPLFGALISQGYTVATTNYPEYGPNRFPRQHLERFGWYTLSHDRVVSVHPRPMRFYIEPVTVALNGLLADGTYSRVDMLGFSAGGWIATVVAAVDPRISGTMTVAGGYPLYLRVDNFERQSPPPQFFQPLLQAANYLEMYVLAAAEGSRTLTQIFNRYDRCCYRNTLARLYEPAVRAAVGKLGSGRFQVLIDETHADHKVSDWAVAQIIEGLAAAAR